MPDFLDHAAERELMYREAALEAALARPPEVEPAGACVWCEFPLEDPTQRWCSVDCRDDWEHFKKAESRNGAVPTLDAS